MIFGCKKGCKSRNYLIYTLYCEEGAFDLNIDGDSYIYK